MSNIHKLEYDEKVENKFAEIIYQRMASKRFGIEFCCNEDNTRWEIKKELLRLNDMKNTDLT